MYDVGNNEVKVHVFDNDGNKAGFLKLGRLKENHLGQNYLDYYDYYDVWLGKPLARGLEVLCRKPYQEEFDYYLISWHDPEGFSDEDYCKPLSREKAIHWFQENNYNLPDDLQQQKIQDKQLQANHSLDFRSVHWYGTDHSFTATQAAIVKELWEAWENGTPDIGQAALLEKVGSESNRLVDVFKDHKTYKQLICKGKTKGTCRLVTPEE